MNHKLIHDKENNRYEFNIPPYVAKIEYLLNNDEIYLVHTEVSQELEGQGIGSELVVKTLEDIEKTDEKLVPLCPFVASYIERHPYWEKLVNRN